MASEPSPDEEALALAAFADRARRARRAVGLPIVACGVVLGVGSYFVLGRLVFAGIDARAPYLVALVTTLPLIVMAQALAAWAGRRAIARRSRAWIAEIAGRGGSPALLEMFVRSLL